MISLFKFLRKWNDTLSPNTYVYELQMIFFSSLSHDLRKKMRRNNFFFMCWMNSYMIFYFVCDQLRFFHIATTQMLGVLILKGGTYETALYHSQYYNSSTYFYSFDFISEDSVFNWIFAGDDLPFGGGLWYQSMLFQSVQNWNYIPDIVHCRLS